MGYKDEKLIVNPTYAECEEGLLNLVVAGTIDAITMVEAAAKEVPEDVLLEALELAHKHIKEICQFQLDYAAQFDIKKIEAEVDNVADTIWDMASNVWEFAELGFEEEKSSAYECAPLEKAGFTISDRGIGGLETSWIATWGSGSPVLVRMAASRRRPPSAAWNRRAFSTSTAV